MRLAGIGEGKIQSYAQFTYRIMEIIHELFAGKHADHMTNTGKHVNITNLTREDIDRIASAIVNRKGWSLSTITIALRTLKRLVHYAKHKEIAEGEGNYCEEVAHIKPDRYKRKAMREDKVRATDLLTREEFLKLIEAVPRISRYPARDRALLYVMSCLICVYSMIREEDNDY
ncbi:MAG: hypothetical protein QXK74_07765 [Candidatus Nitrosocaldaceae archaeon]